LFPAPSQKPGVAQKKSIDKANECSRLPEGYMAVDCRTFIIKKGSLNEKSVNIHSRNQPAQ